MEREELVKRNTEEVITEEELRHLLKTKKKPVVYHGFEPTGKGIHIGYILGIKKLIDFQKAGFEVITLFADLHAWLNEKGSLEQIRKTAKIYEESFRKIGLKNFKAVLGSDFQLKEEYIKDVLKLSLRVRMKRARRAMTIIGREEKNPHVAQVIYPLMQTIDMKALKVDVAFGDLAQRKIHMLARENLPLLGYKAPLAIHHVDMVGLTGGKMSSSIPESMIKIDESPEKIRKKISQAFCPLGEKENNPILQICQYILLPEKGKLEVRRKEKFGGKVEFQSYPELEEAYLKKELHPADLKKTVAEELIDFLNSLRNN